MSLERKITAYCDEPGCARVLDMGADTTQPFHRLIEAGWGWDYGFLGDGDTAVFCPAHTLLKRSQEEK